MVPREGKDSFLFLDGDTNHVFAQITGKTPLSEAQLLAWANEMARRKHHADRRKYKYLFLIAPNKHCVYAEHLPDNIRVSSNRPAWQLASRFPEVFCYPLQVLSDAKNRLVYHKADSHWNNLGCALVFNYLAPILGSRLLEFKEIETKYMGDLGAKCRPPRELATTDIVFDRNSRKIFDNNIHNTGRIAIHENIDSSLPSGLIFGDSFAGDFLDVISEFFSKLYFIHASIFDETLIEKVAPDIVLNLNIERFVSTVPVGTYRDKAYKKIFSSLFTFKNDFAKFNTTQDGISNLDNVLCAEYVAALTSAAAEKTRQLTRFKFMLERGLSCYLGDCQRDFSGEIWTVGSRRNRFSGWGVVFMPRDAAGVIFYLANISAQRKITLKIYEIKDVTLSVNAEANLKPVYRRNYFTADLNIYAEDQPVYFELPFQELGKNRALFMTVEGTSLLGAGKARQGGNEHDPCFVSYFRIEGDAIWREVEAGSAVAWQFAERKFAERKPAAIALCKTSRRFSPLSLPLPPRQFNSLWWLGNRSTRFNAWAVGVMRLFDAQGIAFYLDNLLSNTELTIAVYEISENLLEFDPGKHKEVFRRVINIDELHIYCDRQEVFFDLADAQLEKLRYYCIRVSGDSWLGMGQSAPDLPTEDYLLRGYYAPQGKSVLLPVGGRSAIAWRWCESPLNTEKFLESQILSAFRVWDSVFIEKLLARLWSNELKAGLLKRTSLPEFIRFGILRIDDSPDDRMARAEVVLGLIESALRLRSDIVIIFSESWYSPRLLERDPPLSPKALKAIIAGLLHDGQYEQAREVLRFADCLYPGDRDLLAISLDVIMADREETSNIKTLLAGLKLFEQTRRGRGERKDIRQALGAILAADKAGNLCALWEKCAGEFGLFSDVDIHLPAGINMSCVLVGDGFSFKYVLPVLEYLDRSLFDIFVYHNLGEYSYLLEDKRASEFHVEKRSDELRKYRFVLSEIYYTNRTGLKNNICYTHSMESEAGIYFENCLCMIWPSLGHVLATSMALPTPCGKYAGQISPQYKCEMGYSGSFHAWDGVLSADERRTRLEEAIRRTVPKGRPVIFALEDEASPIGQIVYALNKLTEVATVIFKPWFSFGNNIAKRLTNEIILATDRTVANALRFGADFIMAGIHSGSALSTVMLGQTLIPYSSRICRVKDQRIKSLPFPVQAYPYRNASPLEKAIGQGSILEQFARIFFERDMVFDLLKPELIKEAVQGDSYQHKYHDICDFIRRDIFREFTIDNPARRAAQLINKFAKNGTLGDDCAGIFLKDSFFQAQKQRQ